MKKKIDLIGIRTPNIVVDGKRYIKIFDLAEELFADNIMMEDAIYEDEEKYKGHWIEIDDEIYIDFEALKMMDLVGFYKIYLEVVEECIENAFKRGIN